MKKFLALLILASCSQAPAPPPALPFVTVAQVKSQDMPLYYEYVGHVEANQSVSIKAQVAGQITGQYFIEGQQVKAGDLLLTIDPRPFEAALEKAEGELTQSLANLRQARETAQRNAPLVQQQYISQLDYDQYVTNVYTNEALVQQANAEVENAKINLGYCTIYAPIAGVTSKLLIDVGNYVPVGGDNPLMTLNQITPVRVSIYVPEKDLPRISYLQNQKPLKVTAQLQNLSPAEGNLMLIDNQVSENTGTILIQALFPNEDHKLWPGEFVDVRVILEVCPHAIVLPTQAVQVGQSGHFVFVLKKDSTVEVRNIKIAQREGDITILESGLSAGETVVLDGQMNLNPGTRVAIHP